MRQQEQREHGGLGNVGRVHVAFHELGAVGDPSGSGRAPRQLDHLRIELDAEPVGAALRGGDDVAAVARPQIHHEVLRRDFGHVEHLLDDHGRGRHQSTSLPDWPTVGSKGFCSAAGAV